MEKMVRHWVKKLIPHSEDVNDQDVRSQYGYLGGWLSIVVNVSLFVLKGLFGILLGSVALIADGVHSLSDVATSAIIVASFKWARKPSDTVHPFGHGRMEAIATLVVAVLLVVLGLEFFRTSVGRIIHPVDYRVNFWIVGFVVLTIFVKEWLARFTSILSRMIGSSALEADSWHHRTDALSSILVLGAFAGQYFGLYIMDGIAGIIISGFIVWTGWVIAKDGVDDLLGKRPSAELVDQIKRAVRECSEVLDIHDLIIHQYGQQMVLSFHIQVPETLSLREAHRVSEKVEKIVLDRFHAYATIHLDPVNVADPELKIIREYLQDILDRCDFKVEYHDLRAIQEDADSTLLFDLVVEPATEDREIDRLKGMLEASIMDRFPSFQKIRIKVEPKYAL